MKRFQVEAPTYPVWYFATARGVLAMAWVSLVGLALTVALDEPALLAIGLVLGLALGLVLGVRRYMHLRKQPETTPQPL